MYENGKKRRGKNTKRKLQCRKTGHLKMHNLGQKLHWRKDMRASTARTDFPLLKTLRCGPSVRPYRAWRASSHGSPGPFLEKARKELLYDQKFAVWFILACLVENKNLWAPYKRIDCILFRVWGVLDLSVTLQERIVWPQGMQLGKLSACNKRKPRHKIGNELSARSFCRRKRIYLLDVETLPHVSERRNAIG